jgi:molybdenum cofactor cytidylyltransferase
MMKNLSAVIVASRTQRHLKTPVPLLPFGDTTVLGKTASAYLDAGFAEVILVLGYRGTEIQASLGPLASRLQILIGPIPDEEYGTLVRRGVEKISSGSKAFALGLGDQPLLDKDLLENLADKFAASRSKIMVPVNQGSIGYPLFFDASLAQDFRKTAAGAEPWDVLKAHAGDVLDYAVFHTSVVRHIEDMDDYHEALSIARLPIPEIAPTPEPGSNGTPPEAAGEEGGDGSPGRVDPNA